MLDFILSHKAEIFGALFALSEVIGLVPSIKSSSIFEMVYKTLKKLAGKE